jgi:hypothetical protein
MTSFAFILGVAPLVTATGAGAAGQQALGTAVFGGMIASTVLAVFFVPVFFVLFQRLGEWWSGAKHAPQDEDDSFVNNGQDSAADPRQKELSFERVDGKHASVPA